MTPHGLTGTFMASMTKKDKTPSEMTLKVRLIG